MNSTTSLVAFLRNHAFPVETRSFFRRALLIALGAAFSYCALAAEAKADIRFVQRNYAVPQTPTSPVQVTFTNAQTAGNLNIVVVGWNDTSSTVTSVTDSAGNTYQRAVGPNTDGAGSASQSIYYAANIRGAGANTVTVTFNQAARFPDIRILEYSGIVALSPVDGTTASFGNSAISSTGTFTTTNPNDLIFGANMVQTYTTGPGTGFTNRVITDPDGDIAEDKIVTSAGGYSATAPMGRAGPWVMQAVAFKGATGGTDPSVIGKWSTQSTTLANKINPIHVALLNTGKVLLVAGSGNCPPSQTGCPPKPPYPYPAYIYDAVQGTSPTQISNPPMWDMFCNSASLLANGQALFAGGTIQYDPFYGSKNVAIFDPLQNAFNTNVASMANGRWYPTLTTLPNGNVLAYSGLNTTGSTTNTVEIYNPGANTWNSAGSSPFSAPLYPRMHVAGDGRVFLSGPGTASYFFNPLGGAWTWAANTKYSRWRGYGTSVLLPLTPANGYDPKVMIMGGDNPATNTTEIIDLNNPGAGWQWGPPMSQPRIEMNAVILPTGKILALGGSLNDEDGTHASLNADLYDPVSNTFSSAGANAYARLYHSVALLLPDATVWLAGGNPTRGTYEPHMEIYQPAYLFTPCSNPSGCLAARPAISSVMINGVSSTSLSYGGPFTVTQPPSQTTASVVLVRMGGDTHAFNADQRLVGLNFSPSNGVGTLTVTAPSNSNIAPPGYYMLFIINSSGVPSLATIVQLH